MSRIKVRLSDKIKPNKVSYKTRSGEVVVFTKEGSLFRENDRLIKRLVKLGDLEIVKPVKVKKESKS